MNAVLNVVADVMGALFRVAMWLVTALLALGLLALALVLLLVGVVWALLRGRRPQAPVVVGRFTRFTTERVWPGGPWSRGEAASVTDVVDVEVRDVTPGSQTPPPLPPR